MCLTTKIIVPRNTNTQRRLNKLRYDVLSGTIGIHSTFKKFEYLLRYVQKTATQDIICYKRLEFPKIYDLPTSPYNIFEWIPGVIYETNFSFESIRVYPSSRVIVLQIAEGFHARRRNSTDHIKTLSSVEIWCKMIIPKGAKYIISEIDNDIVATHMMLHSEIAVTR